MRSLTAKLRKFVNKGRAREAASGGTDTKKASSVLNRLNQRLLWLNYHPWDRGNRGRGKGKKERKKVQSIKTPPRKKLERNRKGCLPSSVGRKGGVKRGGQKKKEIRRGKIPNERKKSEGPRHVLT